MAAFAKYKDGTEMEKGIFEILAKFSPAGILDVFASDQHGSYLKLTGAFFKHIGSGKNADDGAVREVCLRFARNLKGVATAALFNHLAYLSPGFRETLGGKVLLIGRLEDTNALSLDGGKGQVARLAVKPEDVVENVDGFKILVKLNPNHKESWEKNFAFASDVFARTRKLQKPLFTETLLVQEPGESKLDFARRLPAGVVKMAEGFSTVGDFYKTQIPLMWIEEDGKITSVAGPQVVRDAAVEIARISPRPLLLLSAAVDFEQYAAQYGIVSDLISGPMCGRAYFKEAFSDPATRDWDSLEESFRRISLPRIKLIRGLANAMSRPWWCKCPEISAEAKALLKPAARESASVKADYGY